MLTMVTPVNGLQLYRTSYAVQSAITATAELLVLLLLSP